MHSTVPVEITIRIVTIIHQIWKQTVFSNYDGLGSSPKNTPLIRYFGRWYTFVTWKSRHETGTESWSGTRFVPRTSSFEPKRSWTNQPGCNSFLPDGCLSTISATTEGLYVNAKNTIQDYYETLRRGEPLHPYFAEEPTVVKFGITERLTGYDEIATGLREQTRTTDSWTVESAQLQVDQRDGLAWFSDDVFMAWRDVESGTRNEYDSRWSGTLEHRGDSWQFVGMHVSAPVE